MAVAFAIDRRNEIVSCGSLINLNEVLFLRWYWNSDQIKLILIQFIYENNFMKEQKYYKISNPVVKRDFNKGVVAITVSIRLQKFRYSRSSTIAKITKYKISNVQRSSSKI